MLRHRMGVAMAALVVLLSVGASACASNTPTLVTAGSEQLEADREAKVLRYSAALRQMREHPSASRVAIDLDLAQRWLRRVESWLDSDDVDEEELALYLEVIDAQLVHAHTTLVRLDEEAALDAARARYDERARSLKQRRDALDAPTSKE